MIESNHNYHHYFNSIHPRNRPGNLLLKFKNASDPPTLQILLPKSPQAQIYKLCNIQQQLCSSAAYIWHNCQSADKHAIMEYYHENIDISKNYLYVLILVQIICTAKKRPGYKLIYYYLYSIKAMILIARTANGINGAQLISEPVICDVDEPSSKSTFFLFEAVTEIIKRIRIAAE